MGGSAPKINNPDPTTVATTQQNLNTAAGTASQAGSMVNQVNPYGSLTYSQSGTGPNGTPLYTANVQLSPQEQTLLNQLQGTQTTAGAQAGTLLSNANYGGTDPSKVIGDATSGNTQALVNQYLSSVQPSQNTQLNRLQTHLSNMGLTPGNPAYDQAMRDAQQGIAQANAGAAAGFEGQAYNQAQQNYLTPLQVSLQELGISQPQTPNSSLVNAPGLNVTPANYQGAVATNIQGQLGQAQLQQAQQNALMSGIAGIAGTAGSLALGLPPGLGGSLGSLFGGGGSSPVLGGWGGLSSGAVNGLFNGSPQTLLPGAFNGS